MVAVEGKNKIVATIGLFLLTLSLNGQSTIYKPLVNILEYKLPSPDLNHHKRTQARSKVVQKNIYDPKALPLFCKMEHLIQKQSQIPVKIRLGDVQYVDKLESKP